jgi:predicted TIM-barrel fold metal-dependent hydrolase
MNVEVRDPALQRGVQSKMAIADCDIHHSPKSFKLIHKYLSKRWCDHIDTYGFRSRQGNASGPQYPKGQPDASRRDAWPPNGGRPGSDLDFMRSHLLDDCGIELGILNMIRPHPGGFANTELSVAVARALNEWQIAEWTQPEPRLKASLVVPYEDPIAAAAEIDHWAGHPDVVQVLLLSRTQQPLGMQRYWPIYEAAARAGLPVGVHAFGNGGQPVSSSGWPSFYIEDMIGHSQSCQSMLTSFVMEGVFERFPTLKLVLIEAGFAWLPPLAWRMDRAWKTLRSEAPYLKRLPSDYIRDHVWLTTQPMEEPEPREHLRDTIEWIGWDRLLFATDYPHWDYDDPARALGLKVSQAEREAFFMGNAASLYRPPPTGSSAPVT